MAGIIVYVTGMGGAGEAPGTQFTGVFRVEGMTGITSEVPFSTPVFSEGTFANVINDSIMDAAVTAAQALGFTIGPSDKKTLIGGAQNI